MNGKRSTEWKWLVPVLLASILGAACSLEKASPTPGATGQAQTFAARNDATVAAIAANRSAEGGFLVLYKLPSADGCSIDLVSVRVTTGGQVVDPLGTPVLTASAVELTTVKAVHAGTHWLVAYNGDGGLFTLSIADDGVASAPAKLEASCLEDGVVGLDPEGRLNDMAWGPDRALIVNRAGRGLFIGTTGAELGCFTITTPDESFADWTGFSGGRLATAAPYFVAVYGYSRVGIGGSHYRAIVLSTAGDRVSSADFTQIARPGHSARVLDVASGNGGFLVARESSHPGAPCCGGYVIFSVDSAGALSKTRDSDARENQQRFNEIQGASAFAVGAEYLFIWPSEVFAIGTDALRGFAMRLTPAGDYEDDLAALAAGVSLPFSSLPNSRLLGESDGANVLVLAETQAAVGVRMSSSFALLDDPPIVLLSSDAQPGAGGAPSCGGAAGTGNTTAGGGTGSATAGGGTGNTTAGGGTGSAIAGGSGGAETGGAGGVGAHGGGGMAGSAALGGLAGGSGSAGGGPVTGTGNTSSGGGAGAAGTSSEDAPPLEPSGGCACAAAPRAVPQMPIWIALAMTMLLRHRCARRRFCQSDHAGSD